MHFWNKLSTAALMRLVILTSLNLLLVRIVGGWNLLVHPWFFLTIVTVNLGLYAIMVYSGTLNTTLIGMMLGGLAATLGTLTYFGMDASVFMHGGPYRQVGRLVESHLNRLLEVLPDRVHQGAPLALGQARMLLISYLVIDMFGLIAILTGGWLARRLPSRRKRRDTATAPPSP
jgi:hypothetical protein